MQIIKEYKINWRKPFTEFDSVIYDELKVYKSKLKQLRFNRVHFKNSSLGDNTEYIDCKFINCKFFGYGSTLGVSTFTNTKFENCKFIGTTLFTNVIFINCEFTGEIENTIISTINRKSIIFEKCNLSKLVFKNVSLYGINIFKETKLPNKGIRVFDNTNDLLLKTVYKITSSINNDSKIEVEVLFSQKEHTGQNQIIYDKYLLKDFFKSEESKDLFDTLVKDFEIKLV